MRAHPPHGDHVCVTANEPASGGSEVCRYEIRVRGPIGPTMMQAFPALTATRSGHDTLLTGSLPDQSALYGVINELETLGLRLLEIRRPNPTSHPTREKTMRAVTVIDYGASPAVMEIPTPEPGPGQVLIKVRAAGMNPMDSTLAAGAWKPMPATFPMVLGADVAGLVEQLGEGTSRFSVGDDLFGQLLIAPLGSAGTYAEFVAVAEDAPLARVPGGLDDVVAASLPTAGSTGLAFVDLLEPLVDKTVLIVGAGGGVGSFATQFAANAGAKVIANVRARDSERMRAYGAVETIDHTAVALPDGVRQAHPDGIDVLIDLVDDAAGFAALASLLRPGGTAVTTRYVADEGALRAGGTNGINFDLETQMSSELLERVAKAVTDRRIVTPPITRISLEEAPAALNPAQPQPASGKTVITL